MIDPIRFLADDTDVLLEQWGRIARVPAPLDEEQARAGLVAEFARAAGADDVEIDAVGNVVTRVDGAYPDGETLTFLATMDDLGSVAAHRRSSDVLRRDGDRLVGPCTETTSSDASALSILRYLTANGSRPWNEIRVAFVLGEETGLTGARHLVAEYGPRLGSVVDLMGGIGTVSWNAIGFAGLEVEFRAAPRHTLYGGRSEVPDAIARLVSAVGAGVPDAQDGASVPISPDGDVSVRRVNRVHAGTVFNHSPETGTVGIDIRSTDPDRLADLDRQTRELARHAASAAGVSVTIRDGERQPAFRLPGGTEHRLVRALAEAIRYAGTEPVLRSWSSSNVNVAYAAGLDGVVHDGTFRGGGRGTADEWTDIPGVLAGVVADCQLVRLLTAPRG